MAFLNFPVSILCRLHLCLTLLYLLLFSLPFYRVPNAPSSRFPGRLLSGGREESSQLDIASSSSWRASVLLYAILDVFYVFYRVFHHFLRRHASSLYFPYYPNDVFRMSIRSPRGGRADGVLGAAGMRNRPTHRQPLIIEYIVHNSANTELRRL